MLTTLPRLARERCMSLDTLRAFVRTRPELAALGVKLGTARVYTADEVKAILAAWEARAAAKGETTAPAVAAAGGV